MIVNIEQNLGLEFDLLTAEAAAQTKGCLVLGVWHGNKLDSGPVKLHKSTVLFIQKYLKQNEFDAKLGATFILHNVPELAASSVLLVGCGKPSELHESNFKTLIAAMVRALNTLKAKNVVCTLNTLTIKARETEWSLRFAVEAIYYELYQFNYFKSKPEKCKLAKIQFVKKAKSQQKLENILTQSQIIAEAVRYVRDLGNMPANICTPSYLARQALSFKALSKKVKVDILDREKLQELGANAMLAVAQGSAEPCQLLTLHYQGGKKASAPIALVGKGVSFDTGGICIKTRDNMSMMKMDMLGAATVLGVFSAVVKLALPINLLVVAPCVENMPDGKSYRPGDILKSLSGQTIEVLDTDAEGRLILCDALSYCERFNPECVIDVATLTGAIAVALGQHFTGLFGNNDALINSLLKAGKQSHDLAWHMPISDEFQKQIDSKVADMANLGGPYGGSITAACFLARFATKYHWAHLDIAGTSMSKDGAIGRPVSLLIQYILNQVE